MDLAVPNNKGREDDDNGLTGDQLQAYIKNCWKKEFRPFYNPQDFVQPMSESDAKRAERDILDEVRLGLGNARTSKNLDLKWKPLVSLSRHHDFLDQRPRGLVQQVHRDERAHLVSAVLAEGDGEHQAGDV